jgi:hypothetical protein
MKLETSEGYWVKVCGSCAEEARNTNEPESRTADREGGNGQDRYASGHYAGHYCDKHWRDKRRGFVAPDVFHVRGSCEC